MKKREECVTAYNKLLKHKDKRIKGVLEDYVKNLQWTFEDIAEVRDKMFKTFRLLERKYRKEKFFDLEFEEFWTKISKYSYEEHDKYYKHYSDLQGFVMHHNHSPAVVDTLNILDPDPPKAKYTLLNRDHHEVLEYLTDQEIKKRFKKMWNA